MIFGIDIISSEALANEAVNIIDRVSDFKSYQLSNVDYKVKFCLDGEPFTVDFHTDDDGLITSCSCTCGLDKCIHKTLALLLFKTSLPPAVAIRALKPLTFCLFLFVPSSVRLIFYLLECHIFRYIIINKT